MSALRTLAAGTVLVAGLGLTACSSSSKGTASPVPNIPSSAAAQGHSTPAIAPTSASSAPSSTAVGLPGGGGGDFCTELTGAAGAIEHLSDAGERDLSKYIDQLRQVAADAPAAIKSDVTVLEQLDEQILNGQKSPGTNPLNSPATAGHLQHFLAWMKTNCPGVLENLPQS